MSETLYELFSQLGGDYLVMGLNFLPEPRRSQELERILAKCLEAGRLNEARETAGLLHEPRRSQELERILAKCVEARRFDEARETADLLLVNWKRKKFLK